MSDLQRQPTATEARFETIYVHTIVRRKNKECSFLKEFGGAARI